MSAPANPILARLTRDSKFPNLPQTIALALALSAATSLVTFYVAPARSILTSLSWFMPFFGPPLIGGLAVLTTGRDSQTEAFTLLKLTPLTRPTVVWGYFWASLYRTRVLLAVLIGVFVPAFIVNQVVTVVLNLSNSCHVFVAPGQTIPPSAGALGPCAAADDPRLVVSNALIWLAYASTLLLAIPCAMLGVAMGLSGRHTIIGAALMAMLLAAIVLTTAATLFLGPTFGPIFYCLNRCISVHRWPIDPFPPLIYLATIMLATLGLDRLARRYV